MGGLLFMKGQVVTTKFEVHYLYIINSNKQDFHIMIRQNSIIAPPKLYSIFITFLMTTFRFREVLQIWYRVLTECVFPNFIC